MSLGTQRPGALARSYPHHGGIILAAQQSWALSELIVALDRLLSQTNAEDWIGQVRWLNQGRESGSVSGER